MKQERKSLTNYFMMTLWRHSVGVLPFHPTDSSSSLLVVYSNWAKDPMITSRKTRKKLMLRSLSRGVSWANLLLIIPLLNDIQLVSGAAQSFSNWEKGVLLFTTYPTGWYLLSPLKTLFSFTTRSKKHLSLASLASIIRDWPILLGKINSGCFSKDI